jgi:hypothetical protein
MSNSYRGPPIDASYQVSNHLAKRFQRRIFFFKSVNQKQESLGQVIWNLVRSIYGRSSIEIAHFVLIHYQTWLPQAILVLDWSLSKNLLLWNCFAKTNQNLVGVSIGYGRLRRNKNCLWRPCLLTDQTGMSNSHRGPSIDASYQDSVYLAKLCQSRRFLEIDLSEKRIVCGSHVC